MDIPHRPVPLLTRANSAFGRRSTEPWLLLLLKLLAWAGRAAGAEKDLLDCRMLLEAAAHGQNLGLTVDELHHHWEHSLSAEGKTVLLRVKGRIETRMEVPRLIQHMNQWEQPFIKGRAGGFGDHAYDPNLARRCGIQRWQTFFNTMDQILRVIRRDIDVGPESRSFAFLSPPPTLPICAPVQITDKSSLLVQPILPSTTVHNLAKSPFFPRPRGAHRVVVERGWYL